MVRGYPPALLMLRREGGLARLVGLLAQPEPRLQRCGAIKGLAVLSDFLWARGQLTSAGLPHCLAHNVCLSCNAAAGGSLSTCMPPFFCHSAPSAQLVGVLQGAPACAAAPAWLPGWPSALP